MPPPPRNKIACHMEWDQDCKLWVGNLGEEGNRLEIEEAFTQIGPVKNIWVARDPPSFAYVEMEDPRDAEDAIKALDGTEICGRRARVEMAKTREERKMQSGASSRGIGAKGGFFVDRRGVIYGKPPGDRAARTRSRSRDRRRDRSRSRSRDRHRRRSSSRSRDRGHRPTRSRSRSRSSGRRRSRHRSRSRDDRRRSTEDRGRDRRRDYDGHRRGYEDRSSMGGHEERDMGARYYEDRADEDSYRDKSWRESEDNRRYRGGEDDRRWTTW